MLSKKTFSLTNFNVIQHEIQMQTIGTKIIISNSISRVLTEIPLKDPLQRRLRSKSWGSAAVVKVTLIKNRAPMKNNLAFSQLIK
jgi:hypothetical protein